MYAANKGDAGQEARVTSAGGGDAGRPARVTRQAEAGGGGEGDSACKWSNGTPKRLKMGSERVSREGPGGVPGGPGGVPGGSPGGCQEPLQNRVPTYPVSGAKTSIAFSGFPNGDPN